MASLHEKTKKFDPLGHATVEAITGIDKSQKEAKDAFDKQAAIEAQRAQEEADAEEALKTQQVETRQQRIEQRAAAAGAVRGGNSSDELGRTNTGRRRYASKVLLGE